MNLISKDLLEWADDGETQEHEDDYKQRSMLLSEPTDIPAEPKTQMDIVKHLFATQRTVCHKDFMERYIPRFGALIWVLRHEEDWVIDKQWCEDESHNHKTQQYSYVFRGVDE